METKEKQVVVDVVGLRDKLSKLTIDKLKEAYTELGIADAWKDGVNKALAVDKAIELFVALKNPTEVENEEVEIPFGEYDVDQDLLDELPSLVELGFNIGDVLVHEEGKEFYKKVVEVSIDSKDEAGNLDTPREVNLQLGYVPEVIDESLYTEEELKENIEICAANCLQALPETRIKLLRKIDALELALSRK